MKSAIKLVLFTAAILTIASASSFAQDPKTAQDELISIVGEAVVEEATRRSEEVRKAKEVLDVVLKSGTPAEQEEAQKDVEKAEEKYAEAQKDIETARVDAYAEKSGKSAAEIQSMRDSGMGWGKIAKEVGIHPSAAGKGKGNSKKDKSKKSKKDKGKKKGDDEDENDEDDDNDKPQKSKKSKSKGKGKKK